MAVTIVFNIGIDGSTSSGRVTAGSNSAVRTANDDFDCNVFGEQQATTTSPVVTTATTPTVTRSTGSAVSTVLMVVMAWMEEEQNPLV